MKTFIGGFVLVVGFCLAASVFAAPALADNGSIDFSLPTVTPAGGGSSDFLWTYTLTLDSQEIINTTLNPSFAVLYDIPGLLDNSETYVPNPLSSVSGATFQQNVGPTAFEQAVPDNPNIPNAGVEFTGNSGAPANQVLGRFSFLDSNSQQTPGFFSGQANLAADNSISGNSSSTPIPTPEPSSFALMLPALVGMGAVLRRKILRR